jgi:hypothetical protein
LVAIAPFESDERTVMSWFGADDEPS